MWDGYCSMGRATAPWGWLLLHGDGYCSMGVATAPWVWLLLHGGELLLHGEGYCSMGRATAPWGGLLLHGGDYCSMGMGITLSLHVLQEEKNILHQVCCHGKVEMFRWLLEKVPQLKSREELNRRSKVRDIL